MNISCRCQGILSLHQLLLQHLKFTFDKTALRIFNYLHKPKPKNMKAKKFLIIFFLVQTCFCLITTAQQKQFKALLVTTTKGWHHESLHYGVVAIEELGRKNFFDVVLFEDPNGFTDEYLKGLGLVHQTCGPNVSYSPGSSNGKSQYY